MRYATVCSGIGAPECAWTPLGWECVFQAEIEKFPSAVLKHHYPKVPNYGDITRFKEWPDHAIDLLIGGTPCQSFSVAGLRAGLADPRGNLALTFLAIAERYRPQWVVWENVPGVIAHTVRCLGLAIRDGKAESLLNTKLSTQALNGVQSAPKSGGENEASASDVISAAKPGTFTTSLLGCLVPTCDSSLVTSLCSALSAIGGCIPDTTLPERFWVEIDLESDYTAIPCRGKPAADGPRYKALGNSMAVPVLRYIGERIALTERL